MLGPNPTNPFSPYQIYPSFEGDLALGQNGSQKFPINITLPKNYIDINIAKEIPFNTDADGDKKCDDLRIITIHPWNASCMIKIPVIVIMDILDLEVRDQKIIPNW